MRFPLGHSVCIQAAPSLEGWAVVVAVGWEVVVEVWVLASRPSLGTLSLCFVIPPPPFCCSKVLIVCSVLVSLSVYLLHAARLLVCPRHLDPLRLLRRHWALLLASHLLPICLDSKRTLAGEGCEHARVYVERMLNGEMMSLYVCGVC